MTACFSVPVGVRRWQLPMIVLAGLASAAMLAGAEPAAALQATPVYAPSFAEQKVGSPAAGVLDNSGWAGGTVDIRIADSGDAKRPRVLECRGNNYCQIAFGNFEVKQGKLYRISLDAAMPGGAAALEVQLRMLPKPWTSIVASKERILDDFSTISFYGRSAIDAKNVCVMLIVHGSVNMKVANLRVEEIEGNVTFEAPPVPGNLALNGSFELEGDGWYVRAWGSPSRPKYVAVDDAPHGRRVAEVFDKTHLSSTWMRLSFQSQYRLRARARVTGEPGTLNIAFVGNASGKWEGQSVTLNKSDGWKIVSLVIQPEPLTAGKLLQYLNGFVVLRADGGPIQVDGVELVAVMPDSDGTFVPHAPHEFGIAIDPAVPMGVSTVGSPVPLRVLASTPEASARLLIVDEDGKLLRAEELTFKDGEATVVLNNLPCGYLAVRTAPPAGLNAGGRVEGESFLCVIPEMPGVPAEEWTYGTHVIDYAPLRQACRRLGWRWDRLHDMGTITKWDQVQPKAKDDWNFQDGILDARIASGYSILGVLDTSPAWIPKATSPSIQPWANQFKIFTDETMPHWNEYVRRSAEHYVGRIDWFEIGNEPQIPGTSPEQYVRVLKESYAALRAGNPRAKVLGLGGVIIGDDFIRRCLELGAADYCDAISIHGYNLTTWATVDGPEKLQQAIKEIRDVVAANGGKADLPIWDSESGTSSPWSYTKFYAGVEVDPADVLDMARMFPKSIAGIKAAGLARWFFYFANDDNFAQDTRHFRICSVNDTMRMPMQPMAVAIATLVGREFVRQETADKDQGVVHLVFTGRGETVHMLWSTKGATILPVPARTKRAINMWGRDSELTEGRITVGPGPQYLFEK